MVTKTAHFQQQQSHYIESLNVTVESYQHATGAHHYHLASDDDNQVFMVALRTLPSDSTGVAHILEHTVLCGSERYPVRDPFFLMLRRSLSNFMNAFTASDWTAYPFATQNLQDYQNLMQVYLDAVFFPNLEEMDFRQEGWRYDFKEVDKVQSGLQYKGVVFNEMKGAMSSPVRQLWHHLCAELYPSSTYHHNSGGDPQSIPELTHTQLCEFHRTFYHPSNAIFFTYGNQPATFSQRLFAEHLLQRKHFASVKVPMVTAEKRFSKPKIATHRYAVDDAVDVAELSNKTHVVIAWLLGNNCDRQQLLHANLLTALLLDNASSPLRKCLEESDLGLSPSPLCGLDDAQFEMVFVAGLEGAETESAAAIEMLIMQQLQQLAKQGFEPEQLEACLHQLELSQRDISAGSMPYGLQLMLNATPAAIHGADVAHMLDMDAALAELRQNLANADFAQSLVRDLLLNNAHRLTLIMRPDVTLSAAIAEREQQQLQQAYRAMSSDQLTQIATANSSLERRQQQPEDESCLPTVSLGDIITDSVFVLPTKQYKQGYFYQANCNGLSYLQVFSNLDLKLTGNDCSNLSLLLNILGELGHNADSYAISQNQIALHTAGLNFASHLWQPLDQQGYERPFYLRFGATTKGLQRNHQRMLQLLLSAITAPNFTEQRYIRDLLAQCALAAINGVTNHAHALAMQTASSYFSSAANYAYHGSGLKHMQHLISVHKTLDDKAQLAHWLADLQQLQQQLLEDFQCQQQWQFITDAAHLSAVQQHAQQTLHYPSKTPAQAIDLATFSSTHQQLAWSTEANVNYCASAFKAVGICHADAMPLMVLASFLRDRYLHTAIREQGGAYGGGAQFDAASETFRFYSYRDPRCEQTFADFAQCVKQFVNDRIETQHLQQAIFGVSARLSSPLSAPQQAKADFLALQNGVDKAFRDQLRQAVIAVTAQDLQRVAATYLVDKPQAKVVVCNKQTATRLQQQQGFEVESLYL